MSHNGPIGVLDSGMGGISVLNEMRSLLPDERFIYVADSGHVPYGPKPAAYIQERCDLIAGFLLQRGAKALVIACNTATAAAADQLRSTYSVPVLGMEPAVKPASAATRKGVVGVLATSGTLASARFAALLDRFAGGIRVITQPAPELVLLVEAGDLDSDGARAACEVAVRPLIDGGADVIVHGCTHFPFLKPVIAGIVGPRVIQIDTGAAVARHLKSVLGSHALLAESSHGGADFFTSGDLATGHGVVSRLFGEAAVEALPDRVR
ncbi:MAG TPA: glutamate racemase [Candidatus Dormibacteraeota bacterium]|nr:glutamate racemase [Candidatus Dormibacteraeota bacterium]